MREEPQIVVRRLCKYGEPHPHAVRVLSYNMDHVPDRWCTDGDSRPIPKKRAVTLIYDQLTAQDPRVEIDVAMVKAREIVELLLTAVRQ